MKGLTHFTSGVAVGSFFSTVVRMSAAERTGVETAEASFIMVLAGLYGILPDTLDFKLGQFFSKAEFDVECDPQQPDPQKMAEQIGKAMEAAYFENRMVKAQLYPMQLGNNLWRQYVIKFDGDNNEVVVIINEIVSTSQVSYPGTEPQENRVGRYKLQHGKILETHGRPSIVDIMSGPQYGFVRQGENVRIEFLPWHRTWSHSYVLGLMLAAPWWLIAWLLGFSHWPLYGLIAFLGFAVHITEDLTGHMGGSLIWPFIKKRTGGLAWFTASDPRANFAVDYLALALIIFNLDRFTFSPPQIAMSVYWYVILVILLPITLYLSVFWLYDRGFKRVKSGEVSAHQALELDAQQRQACENEIRRQEIEYEEDHLPGG